MIAALLLAVATLLPAGVPAPPETVDVPAPASVPDTWTSEFQQYAWQRFQVIGDHKNPPYDYLIADDPWTFLCVVGIAQAWYPSPADFVAARGKEFRQLWHYAGVWCF